MDSVLSALNENIQEGDKHAEVLYEQMDQTFISATKYLADLTNILKKLINIFQLEHLSLSHFKSQLDTTLKAIQTEFIGSEETQPNYGTIFKKYLDEHDYFVPQFVAEYSIAVINAIKNRFQNLNYIVLLAFLIQKSSQVTIVNWIYMKIRK